MMKDVSAVNVTSYDGDITGQPLECPFSPSDEFKLDDFTINQQNIVLEKIHIILFQHVVLFAENWLQRHTNKEPFFDRSVPLKSFLDVHVSHHNLHEEVDELIENNCHITQLCITTR
ncbi:uncharacterized protein LOC142329945 isoform X1 [Lycorma delicatula]|uniref:uncharacterized protein LOC142329945 isoform X1 n=1 Tax=Lycorma delicatula TaxID=130591 RepID=UPI003F51072C